MYYDWTVTDDARLATWAGGLMQGKTYRYVGENEYADLITWYDIEVSIAYSLSTTAEDLDGFDIQAIAEQMYAEENDPAANAPADSTPAVCGEAPSTYMIPEKAAARRHEHAIPQITEKPYAPAFLSRSSFFLFTDKAITP